MDGCTGCGVPVSQELPTQIEELVHDHPCYSEEAHYHYARMHLPVAPACNIQCRYCNRLYDCVNESRPGVTSQVLTPEEASQRALLVAQRMPQVTVVGIAGPGDPLANPRRTFRTFRLVAGRIPDVRLCLSTNGLTLVDHVDRLKGLGIKHVTITINAVDPQVGEEIYEWVYLEHRRYQGREAAAILIEKQLAGLQALSRRGILCKVNSVLIPSVNDDHLAEVSRTVKGLGAFSHNIMPLIVVEGSYFGDHGHRGPTLAERKRVRELCGDNIRLMHHCRQCRSDAIGLLSEDVHQEILLQETAEMDADQLLARRQQMRLEIEGKVDRVRQAKGALVCTPALEGKTITAAVASKGHGVVNMHFGHAKEFLVYQVSHPGIELLEVRKVEQYCGGPATCGDEEELLTGIASMLSDCQYLLCSRIGPGPKQYLEGQGIQCVETYDFIHEALGRIFRGENWGAQASFGSAEGVPGLEPNG